MGFYAQAAYRRAGGLTGWLTVQPYAARLHCKLAQRRAEPKEGRRVLSAGDDELKAGSMLLEPQSTNRWPMD